MKKILALLTLTLLVVPTLAIASFSDVNSSTDYENSINWLANEGVIYGHPDGTFKPDDCVNRAEFLKMLFKATESEWHMSEIYYPDVPVDAWYQEYVSYFSSHGVVQGYPDGTFKPSKCVNRAEAVKMAFEGFDPTIIGTYGFEPPYPFEDLNQDAWYYYYVYNAFLNAQLPMDHMGISDIQNGKGYYGPNESMSRKEVAALLYRIKATKDADHQTNYYSESLIPNEIVPKFDGCGDLDSYQDEDWFLELESAYSEMKQALTSIRAAKEACYSESGNLLVIIDSLPDREDKCGEVLIYDIESGWLRKPLETNNEIGAAFYACEFGKRVGDYIVVSVKRGDGATNTDCQTSKLFFLEDKLEHYACLF